jgi:hypothetical protein
MVDGAMLKAMKEMVRLQKVMNENFSKMASEQREVASANEELSKTTRKMTKDGEKFNTIFGKMAIGLREQTGFIGRFKRVAYGFLPQGAFRLVNKFASAFENLDLVLGVFMKKAESDAPASLGDNLAKVAVGAGKMGKAFLKLKPADLAKPFKALKAAQDEFYFGDLGGAGLIGVKAEAENVEIRKQKARIKRARRGMARGSIPEDAGLAKVQDAESKLAEARERKRDLLLNANSKVLRGIGKVTEAFKKIPKLLGMFLKGALTFFGYAAGIVIALYLAFRAFGPQIMDSLKATWEAIKAVGMVAMAGLMVVWDGLKDIWNAFFGGGDLVTLIDGLLKVAGGLLLFVAGLAITALTAGLVLLGGLIKETLSRTWGLIKSFFDPAISGMQKVAMGIALIAGIIAFIASGAWAAAIAATIGFYVAKKLGGFFGFHADGGTVKTPMQIVGERGPELVSLPRGSRVHTNAESKRMAAGGGNTFNITINARDTSDAELRRIAEKIGQMINGRINRTTSSRTLGA